MIKNVSRLEHVIENRAYQLIVESDSPISHVKEACFQFLAYCAKVEEMAKEQLAQQESEKPVEEVQDERKEEAQEASSEAS